MAFHFLKSIKATPKECPVLFEWHLNLLISSVSDFQIQLVYFFTLLIISSYVKFNVGCLTDYVQFQIKNEKEANSLLSYLKCRLPNLMLSLRKNSQLISKNTCKWISLPPLNKEWNDEEGDYMEFFNYWKIYKNYQKPGAVYISSLYVPRIKHGTLVFYAEM